MWQDFRGQLAKDPERGILPDLQVGPMQLHKSLISENHSVDHMAGEEKYSMPLVVLNE